MPVPRTRLAAFGFMIVGLLSLAAAVLPLAKGRPVNLVFLGGAVVWIVISIVIGRTPGAGAEPPKPE